MGRDAEGGCRGAIPPPAFAARIVEADQGDLPCPAPFAKIFPFRLDPNQQYIPRRPVPQRGVSRTSQTRDRMRWTRAALLTRAPTRTAKSCGRDAPTLASSWRKPFPPMTVANKPGHRGERRK